MMGMWPLLTNRQLGGILQIQKSSPNHLSYFRDTLITKKKMIYLPLPQKPFMTQMMMMRSTYNLEHSRCFKTLLRLEKHQGVSLIGQKETVPNHPTLRFLKCTDQPHL